MFVYISLNFFVQLFVLVLTFFLRSDSDLIFIKYDDNIKSGICNMIVNHFIFSRKWARARARETRGTMSSNRELSG